MVIDADNDLLPTERIGLVVYTLMANRGKCFTTVELAEMVGVTRQGAHGMLCKLSRTLPIVQEPNGEGWKVL